MNKLGTNEIRNLWLQFFKDKGHNVEEISRSDSGAINLSKTASSLYRIIEDSKKNNRSPQCFRHHS